MRTKSRVRSVPARMTILPSLIFLTSTAGCVADEDPGVLEEGVATSALTVTYDLDDSGAPVTKTWLSGNTNSLSGFQGVSCADQAGNERLLVKLQGFREPSLNQDAFVARLRATCRNYEANNPLPYAVGFPVVDETDLVFTSDHRSDSGTSEVVIGGNGDNVPVGVRLKVNEADGYVKDFDVMYMVATSGGLISLQNTAYAMGLSGTEKTLTCPSTTQALTGVKVNFSTNSGKIRQFRIECNKLVN